MLCQASCKTKALHLACKNAISHIRQSIVLHDLLELGVSSTWQRSATSAERSVGAEAQDICCRASHLWAVTAKASVSKAEASLSLLLGLTQRTPSYGNNLEHHLCTSCYYLVIRGARPPQAKASCPSVSSVSPLVARTQPRPRSDCDLMASPTHVSLHPLLIDSLLLIAKLSWTLSDKHLAASSASASTGSRL